MFLSFFDEYKYISKFRSFLLPEILIFDKNGTVSSNNNNIKRFMRQTSLKI